MGTAEERVTYTRVSAAKLHLCMGSTNPTGTVDLSRSATERGEGHEQPAQGVGPTPVGGEIPGMGLARHPRHRPGEGGWGVEGDNLTERGEVARVAEKLKPEGRKLVVEGDRGESGEPNKRRERNRNGRQWV